MKVKKIESEKLETIKVMFFIKHNLWFSCFSLLVFHFSLFTFLFLPAISVAATVDNQITKDCIITDIIVKENHYIDRDEIIDMMGIKIGDKLNHDIITNGIKSAFLKGLFTDIKVSTVSNTVDNSSVQLIIEVTERQIIDSISIIGLDLLRRDIIREVFEIKEGMVYYENEAVEASGNLVKQIEKFGFPDAQVTTEITKKENSNKVKIKLTVKENKPLTIKQIVIPVDKPLIENQLDISIGDIYNEKEINEKIQSIVTKFREKGYYRFQINHQYIKASEQLELDVDKGDRLEVTFNGNENISKPDLIKELLFLELESTNNIVIKESIDKLIKLYHKKGYCDVQIGYDVNYKDDIIEIVFNIKEGGRYKISTITIKGSSIDQVKIKNALTLREGDVYNPDFIETDKQRLIGLYHLMAFKDITIESVDTTFIEDINKAAITITIKEGLPVTIESISTEGNTVIPNTLLLSIIGIKTGGPYYEDIANNAVHIISSQYIKLGYKDVKVTYIEKFGHAGVQLTFVITEGKKYIFGGTIIKGNVLTSYQTIQSAIKHKRGQPYDYNMLLSETIILNKTGLFKGIEIKIVERQDYVIDVVFEVEEANRWVLETGFGYAEYVGFRGFVDLGYKNVFGGNREIRLRAEGNQLSQMYSIIFLEPWFMPEISFKSVVSFTHLDDENIDTGQTLYLMDKYTATAGVEHPITKTLRVKLYYEISRVETYDVQPDAILSKEDTGTLLIGSMLPSIIYDSRDNPFDPRKGAFSGLTLKYASNIFLSQTNFIKLSGYYNEYIGVTDYITLASSFRSGASYRLGQTSDLPLIERFFLGGMNTLRGFLQDQVGPKSINGIPIGGNFFCLGNIETRVDIVSGFGTVVFFDIGNVWVNIADVDFTVVRKAAGVGIRYLTPVGPFRLDYGYKLDRWAGEDPGEFHFSFGYAF